MGSETLSLSRALTPRLALLDLSEPIRPSEETGASGGSQAEQQQQQASSRLNAGSPSNRSPSPGFPSPSSTFVPPPSEEEEMARMKALDIAGHADGARRAKSSGGDDARRGPTTLGNDDKNGQSRASGSSALGLAQADGQRADAKSALVINSPAGEADQASSDRGGQQPAASGSHEQPADSNSPPSSRSGGSAFSDIHASSPHSPSDDEAAFARATARSFPTRMSGGSRQGSETSQSSRHQQTQPHHQHHQHQHQHHHHPHHHSHQQGIQGTAAEVPEGRPHVLGSASTHSKTHPGTIMYPQPHDPDEDGRPLPGDRSRPSQERVQRMHDTIEQRDRDFEAEQDAKHRKQTSDQAEREARELANPTPKRPPLPQVIVRDYAFPPDDERFAGQGPLRASLFYSNDGDDAPAPAATGPGTSWGFGGWKADQGGNDRGNDDDDDDDEGEWHDDDDEEGEEEEDEHRHQHEHPHSDIEPDPIEPGKYEALYA
jgi:hypothetical protein